MIGLVRCDVPGCVGMSVRGVVGPHRVVRLCQKHLEQWRAWRELIYGEDHGVAVLSIDNPGRFDA